MKPRTEGTGKRITDAKGREDNMVVKVAIGILIFLANLTVCCLFLTGSKEPWEQRLSDEEQMKALEEYRRRKKR